MYSFFNLGVRWGGWLTSRDGRFTPGKDLADIVQEVGWAPRPVWSGEENLSPIGIRSLGRQAHSESLYPLRYLGHFNKSVKYITKWTPQTLKIILWFRKHFKVFK
jgi:hypothetical protein